MKEKIYEAIKLQNGKLTFSNLRKRFRLGETTLKNLLLELKLDGKIIQSGNKYILFPNDNHIGEISLTGSGNKVIFYDGQKIFISSNFLDNIIFNDVVSFKINSHGEAEITSVIERRFGNITCEIGHKNGKKVAIPYQQNFEVTLPTDVMENLTEGDVVMVNISTVDAIGNNDAKFVKKLFNKSDPNKEEEIIALNHGFDRDYSDKYMKELEKIPTEVTEEEVQKRTDYRKMRSFTIDGRNTKDMDDALGGVEMLEDGTIRYYVHIAHPNYYIPLNSEIFKRALEKTTSLYLNNSVFHMLHSIISNGICSLNPGEDRITISVMIDMSIDGIIKDFNIVSSVINSDKKMCYDDVDKILLGQSIPEGYEEFVDDLKLLSEAATRFENKLLKDGAIEFANNELDIVYDINNNIASSSVLERSPARKLIEYLMISANTTVLTFLFHLGIPAIFRVHELPDVRRINEMIDVINQIIDDYNKALEIEAKETGKTIKRMKKIKHLDEADSPKKVQAILNSVDDKLHHMVSDLMLQCMQRARYTTENHGHYALSLDIYGHFTSPIRRLADFIIHILLDLVLEHPEKLEKIDLVELKEQLEMISKHASVMERSADIAEREAQNLLLLKSMKEHIDEEYEAIVLEVSNKVKIRINHIDTYIEVESLNSNFKRQKNGKYYDLDNGMLLKPGSKINVTLKKVDLTSGSIRVTVNGIVNSKKLVKK